VSWATPEEAASFTGRTVDQAALDAAQSVIDLYTDLHEGVDPGLIDARTMRILKQAVAWQAVWQGAQGDTFGTGVVKKSETLGDYSYTRQDDPAGDDIVLAPMAARWIGRLKWRRTRTIDPLTAPERVLVDAGDSDYEFMIPWRPM